MRAARPETERLAQALRGTGLSNTTHMPMPVPASLRTLECQATERTLAALDGNVSATAKALDISRNTIDRRRQALGSKAS